MYCKSCVACQKHKRKTKFDRLPIVAVPRALSSFEHVYIDLIGPIEPKSSKQNAYVLCVVDSCTRCPTDRVDFESELNQIDLSHLPVSQKLELCALLRKYTLMFLVINQVTVILQNMK